MCNGIFPQLVLPLRAYDDAKIGKVVTAVNRMLYELTKVVFEMRDLIARSANVL